MLVYQRFCDKMLNVIFHILDALTPRATSTHVQQIFGALDMLDSYG
jgi:hypothetical protein